jgi:uncharacterized membrane protein
MSVSVSSSLPRLDSIAAKSLQAAAAFWFAVAVLGQLIFAIGVVAFYGRATARGDALAWNKFMTHAYMPGHTANTVAAILHVVTVVIILVAGALQLTPQIRARLPSFHRWNGRVWLGAALAASLAGLWMVWVRGTPGTALQHGGLTLNALLVLLFGTLALRTAMARDFTAHRRWALRLFVVMNGVWFFRVIVFLSFAIFQGPFGFNPRTFAGPFLTIATFASYLLPLAVLELYMRTQDRPTTPRRFAMASALAVLTLAMGAGSAIVTFGLTVPAIAAATGRTPIAETLSVIIASDGIDAALQRYQVIKSTQAAAYKIDEDELNALGYQLIHSGRLNDAIRILQRDVADHPNSANAYDSLGEAYMDAGLKQQAITSYEKSFQLNPANANAADALRELDAPEILKVK